MAKPCGCPGNHSTRCRATRRPDTPALGDAERSEAALVAGLRLFAAIRNPLYLPWSLDGLAALASRRGHYERAARLLGASASLRERVNSSLPPVDPAQAVTIAVTRTGLGEETYAAAYENGGALSQDQPFAMAPEQLR